MNPTNHDLINSPDIRRNSTMKRQGLSRKRKNFDFEYSSTELLPCAENIHKSNSDSSKIIQLSETLNNRGEYKCENLDSIQNYNEQIELLQLKLKEKSNKLKKLEDVKERIDHLDKLIESWRIGCHYIVMNFFKLLKESDSNNIDYKTLLNKLGIQETLESFGIDTDSFN